MNAMRGKSLIPTAACLAALVAASVLPAADEGGEKGGGFGIGPGMVMVEQVQPGADEFDVEAKTGVVFEVANGTDKEQHFTVSARTAKSCLGSWEMGYDDIPDVAWLRLDKTELDVPANSRAKVKLYLKIPDQPEHYNRKWMAVVACSPGKPAKGGSSVGLMVAARVQIETVVKVDASGKHEGPMGLTPSGWMVSEAPVGGIWAKTVKVRNNTKDEHTYTVKRIADLEKNPAKFDRYHGNGFVAVTKESWTKAGEESFTVKPGEEHPLRVTVTVPASAEGGKRYEELVFLQDDKGAVGFFRLRTEVVGTEAGTLKTEKP